MKVKSISRVALGRVHGLGEIYDAVEERFIGVSVFADSITRFTSEMDCGGSEYFFVMDDTISEKFEKLDVEAELKMSFLAGMVKVEGSGKYLKESKKDTKTLSYSVIFKIRTKKQSLNIFNRNLRNGDTLPIDLIDPSLGTHIVSSITWGANIIATFEMSTKDVFDKNIFEGSVKAFARMAALEISGAARIENSDREKFYNNNLKIKIIGDIIPSNKEKLVTDLDGFNAFLREVPSLLKQVNNGYGVPIDYCMFPLEMLYDKNQLLASRIIKDMNEESLNKIVRCQEEVASMQAELNELIEECNRYEIFFTKTIKHLYFIKNVYEL